MESVRSFLINDIKPESVTFTPSISKTVLNKETAEIRGVISSKTIGKGGKTYNNSVDFALHMEYMNGEWVVVGFYPQIY